MRKWVYNPRQMVLKLRGTSDHLDGNEKKLLGFCPEFLSVWGRALESVFLTRSQVVLMLLI